MLSTNAAEPLKLTHRHVGSVTAASMQHGTCAGRTKVAVSHDTEHSSLARCDTLVVHMRLLQVLAEDTVFTPGSQTCPVWVTDE